MSSLIISADQLKPVSSAYARYAPEATFHDPIGLANGLEAVVRHSKILCPYYALMC